MSVEPINRRVELHEGPFPGTGMCPGCNQSASRYVRLLEPAFLGFSGHGDAPSGQLITQHTGDAGELIYRTTSPIAGEAYREYVQLPDLWLCEGCWAGGAELIGYGDVTEAEARAEQHAEHAADLKGQVAELEQQLGEVRKALAASGLRGLELEAMVEQLQNGNGNGHAAEPEPAPKPKSTTKRKASA